MALILVTDRDWFPAALQGILEPEDFELRRIGDLERLGETIRSGSLPRIDAVLIDAHIEGRETPAAIRKVLAGPLSREIPILVYSSGQLEDGHYAELLEAGAWEVVEGPIRSVRFLAVLRRLTEIGGRPRDNQGDEHAGDADHPLADLDGLFERLPVVEAIAQREGASIAVMAIGPTVRTGRTEDRGQVKVDRVADLRRDAIRKSDLCAWLDTGEDFVVVAYAASREGAEVLADRIAKTAAERFDVARPEDALSVGIVELQPEDLPERIPAEARSEPDLAVLSRARKALEEAREAGGGVRFAA